LCSLQPGLKFVLPELGDNVVFGDALSFFDRQVDKQTGYLECHLDVSQPLDPAGEGTYMQAIPGGHDHRFHGANHLWRNGLLR
jgi:hypothetical protein